MSPRAKRSLMHRGPFEDSLTWFEIHGNAAAVVEHWNGFIEAIKAGLLKAGCDAPLVADVHFKPAAAMTAAVFFTMAAMARRTKADMNSLGRFLMVGVVVLMVGVVANMFLQIPALGLTISAGFVIFSSLLIMFQIRNIIDGGETSHVSAALTIFVSLYNIFSSLLHILTSLFGEE